MNPTILIIDDDPGILTVLEFTLRRKSYNVIAVTNIHAGLKELDGNGIDMIFCDLRVGEETGIDFLRSMKKIDPDIPVAIMTGYPDIDSVAESLRLQAFDYLKKPVEQSEIYRTAEKGIKYRALIKSKRDLEAKLEKHHRRLHESVREKTAELSRTNEKLLGEIYVRKEAENYLKELNEKLKTEIRERKQIVNELRESENRYRAMFDQMSSGVAIYQAQNNGRDFVFRDFNRSAEKIENIPRIDVVGKNVLDVFPGVVEFGILDVLRRVWKTGRPERFPLSLYKDNRISGWRENHVYRLPSGEIVTIYDDITEKKQIEEALNISEKRLHMAMEAANEGLWDYDLKSQKIYFSPRWYTMLGYKPYELAQSIDTWSDLLHPDDLEQFQNEIEARVAKDDAFRIEFRLRSKTGEWRWIKSQGKVFSRDESGNPIRVVGTHIDITEQKNAEEQLRQAHLELDQIFNSASDGMCLVDTDSGILKINKTMSGLFGWEEQSVRGKPFFNLLPPYVYRFAESPNDSDINRIEHDLTFTYADGRIRYMILTATPFKNSGGNLKGLLYNIRDITKRVEAEKETERNRLQIIQADKMKSLGILVSGVAHEINNPNNFIMMNTSILMKVWDNMLPILENHHAAHGDFLLANIPFSQMKTHIPELFDGLRDGSERIKKLITDLKDYARGSSADVNEPVNLNKVVETAISLIRNLIGKSTDSFETELAEKLPDISGNFHRIEQVAINLIENACQALTGRDQRIIVQTFRGKDGNLAALRVSDEGIGIPEEHLNEIFDPFFTTKRDLGGTGLGLSVCAGIVKEYNGELKFDSKVGKGTTVTVMFPSQTESPKRI